MNTSHIYIAQVYVPLFYLFDAWFYEGRKNKREDEQHTINKRLCKNLNDMDHIMEV